VYKHNGIMYLHALFGLKHHKMAANYFHQQQYKVIVKYDRHYDCNSDPAIHDFQLCQFDLLRQCVAECSL